MFGLDLLTPETLGIVASVVAALVSLVPALGVTEQRRAGVAIGTIIVFILMQDNFTFISLQEVTTTFFQAAVYALASYKMILQPLVLPAATRALVAAGVKSNYTG